MKFTRKSILSTLLLILALLQFYRPARNDSNLHPAHIGTSYPIPADVEQTLKAACYDCHSNYTVYPWYAEIQPLRLWLDSHVNGGKKHLNFSEFTSRKIAVQYHKFEEIDEMVKEGEMPMSSYTLIHRDAVLTPEKKQALLAWVHTQMDTLKAKYPADSLILKRQ